MLKEERNKIVRKFLSVIFVVVLVMNIGLLVYMSKSGFQINSNDEKNKHQLEQFKKSIDNEYDDLVHAITLLNQNVDPLISRQIVKVVIKEGKSFDVPPLLIVCLINEESGFNQVAFNSKSKATGLMQIIPKWHEDRMEDRGVENIKQLFFIEENISIGTEILKEYIVAENYDVLKGLQRYVGATDKNNASKYIENIMNNYISLSLKLLDISSDRQEEKSVDEVTSVVVDTPEQ